MTPDKAPINRDLLLTRFDELRQEAIALLAAIERTAREGLSAEECDLLDAFKTQDPRVTQATVARRFGITDKEVRCKLLRIKRANPQAHYLYFIDERARNDARQKLRIARREAREAAYPKAGEMYRGWFRHGT